MMDLKKRLTPQGITLEQLAYQSQLSSRLEILASVRPDVEAFLRP